MSAAGRPDSSFVVVGGGMAGGRAAEFLALRGRLAGKVVLVGAEDIRPYHRPHLSKGLLTGEIEVDDVFFRPEDFYARRGIELKLGVRATALDAEHQTLTLDDGTQLPFSRLILAPGTMARPLPVPGTDLRGVHELRGHSDSAALRTRIVAGSRVVIIGGGFIGTEVAAACRRLGASVTVVESAAAPLATVLGPEVGTMVQRAHESRGVVFRVGCTVERLAGTQHVESVELAGGESLPADVVVVGIGVVPDVAWLNSSGIELDNGIVVDEFCHTSMPDVFAAGDAARWNHPLYGTLRLEHETNAQNQAMAAARNALGQTYRYRPLPYVWSDQNDLKIRYVGHTTTWDDVIIETGAATDAITAAYVADGRVRAVLTVNDTEALTHAEKLLQDGPFMVEQWTGRRASASHERRAARGET